MNDPVTLGCLGVGDNIPAPDTLVGLGDGDGLFLKVEVRRGEGQQFPLPHSASVEHFKGVVGQRLVHHDLRKFQVLCLCPEQHFPALGLAHVAHLGGGVDLQIVVPHSVVEHGAQLRKDLSRVISAERSQIINVKFLQKQGATVFYGNPLLFSSSYRIKFQ